MEKLLGLLKDKRVQSALLALAAAIAAYFGLTGCTSAELQQAHDATGKGLEVAQCVHEAAEPFVGRDLKDPAVALALLAAVEACK
jgi:hypothetical protein